MTDSSKITPPTADLKTLVIKVGGALLQHTQGMTDLMKAVAAVMAQGHKVILVHGGGCLVEQQLDANQMQTQKLNGLRVTPAEQLPIVVGVLAGTANKQLQAAAIGCGITAIGMSLADGNIVTATLKDKALGFVGEVQPNQAKYLNYLLSQGWLPIVSSIAASEQGELLNVNADDAATAVAHLVDGQLVLLSDVPGVLDGQGELITTLDQHDINELIDSGVIASGMKVKVEAALDVAQKMNKSVQVASWKEADKLLALVNGEPMGTQIKPN